MLPDLDFKEAKEDYTLFKDLSSNNYPDTRLYYKGNKEERTLYFKLIRITSMVSWSNGVQYSDNPDENPTTRAEVLAHGYGFFDGVRHLYFTSDADDCSGYWYYPDLILLKKFADALLELEIEFGCNDK